jgi:hypothetical protein
MPDLGSVPRFLNSFGASASGPEGTEKFRPARRLALRRAAEHVFKLLDRPFQPSIKYGPRSGVYASLEMAENGCCPMRERTNRHATLVSTIKAEPLCSSHLHNGPA